MQIQLDLYKVWAPADALWTQWVKPAVFMNMKLPGLSGPSGPIGINPPAAQWIGYEPGTAIIVDLAGLSGINEGIGLARLGYRPIPLYNGIPSPGGSKAAVPVDDIVAGLWGGARELTGLGLPKTASPAFLLDAMRMKGAKKKPGTFDNRWCVVPQDMPSASYLKRHRIRRIVVRAQQIETDLQHILYQYQSNGIAIAACRDRARIVPCKINKPDGYKALFYRFLIFLGLARSAAGGFGSAIPAPEESSGGRGGHYRAG